MLSISMLTVIVLSVVMPSVVVPSFLPQNKVIFPCVSSISFHFKIKLKNLKEFSLKHNL